ncbi:hypothetical protein HMPREF1143_1872 [Peptoanaerobacter stomatis]|uniref:Uncharacterized protein n=1 Tax=Peptoanaerobacter stomatis TaxID=796937 RepID=J6HAA5_9FIRM|nr:hypothetical protein [Peptoanaerobacter stomatis]EJU19798.1 hypothetical protein HMPREF1143_1872 [Peptoanaerobacter stomatis]NWO24609.1 hypothetical protein [Peptostreptococcaceae bacterium oral taxon 081]
MENSIDVDIEYNDIIKIYTFKKMEILKKALKKIFSYLTKMKERVIIFS